MKNSLRRRVFLFGFYINFNFFPLLKSVSPSRKRETVTGTHHDDRPCAQPLCFTSVVPYKVFYSPFIFLGLFSPRIIISHSGTAFSTLFPHVILHNKRTRSLLVNTALSSLKRLQNVGSPAYLFLFRTNLKSNCTRNTGPFKSVESNDGMAEFVLPGKFDKTDSLVLTYNIHTTSRSIRDG